MGTLNDRSGSDPSYPRRPATVGSGGGACVVVGARESRVQGKGRQGTDRRAKTEETPVDSEIRINRGSLIGGLFYGVEGMRVGGTRRLEIAPRLAYAERGVPGVIPPGATLIAEITILET